MSLAARYPDADTRSEPFRQMVIEDVLAVSLPTESVAMITEAIRKAFAPDTAASIYRAIGAAADTQDEDTET